MSKSCKVSVIIPCFNHGEFLPDAIASVPATKRDEVEIIVIDDGSTDERTHKEIDALESSGTRVIRKQNGGPASARNAGIKVARGEYIFPLDSDDHMRPNCLEREVSILDANPQVGIVYSDGEFFGVRSGRWNIGPFDANRLLEFNYIACCALFRRRIWEQVGGYDEARVLWGSEDWDFWLGALDHGWEFAYVPEVLFEYRVAKESMVTHARAAFPEAQKHVTRKYAQLYRNAWLGLMREREQDRESLKLASRNLTRLLRTRLRQKFGVRAKPD